MSPVALRLGMNLRVAVALRSRGVQIAGLVSLRNFESIDGSRRADEEGFKAEPGVVDWTCGRGKVEDEVDVAYVEGLTDIDLGKVEAGLVLEVGKVCFVAGAQIVDADDGVSRVEQGIAKVRAKKTCSSRYEDSF